MRKQRKNVNILIIFNRTISENYIKTLLLAYSQVIPLMTIVCLANSYMWFSPLFDTRSIISVISWKIIYYINGAVLVFILTSIFFDMVKQVHCKDLGSTKYLGNLTKFNQI